VTGDFTKVLNKEGFFFQKYCVQKIKESDWVVDAEEYPISEEESFDIKAVRVLFETALHTAVIECKKADPCRKCWIFFGKESTDSEQHTFLIQTHNLSSSREGRFHKGFVVRGVYEGVNEAKLGYPSCHTVGLELFKKDLKDQRDWKVNSQVVFEACLTVAKGINQLFDSEAERISNTLQIGRKQLQKYGSPYFVGGSLFPVVITSAPLFSAKFDPNTIDIATFEVPPEKVTYEEKEWLVYEFPLPRELQRQSKDMFKIIGENRYAKMHIFIVNGRYVAKFFNALVESIKTRSEKSWRTLETEFTEFYKPKKC
jgi:hypothetical protein